MRRSFDLVVFDWEGTLGDPLGHIFEAMHAQAQAMGLGSYDEQEARLHVVRGLEYVTKKLFPSLSLTQSERCLQGVQQAMASLSQSSVLFPGAKRLLSSLKEANIELAIATNKGQHALVRSLQQTGLLDYFVVTRSAGQTLAKPAPQMLEEIMLVCGVPAVKTLMIGDSVIDIEMASLADVVSIGIDFYYQQADDLKAAGAAFVCHDYEAVGRYLELPGY